MLFAVPLVLSCALLIQPPQPQLHVQNTELSNAGQLIQPPQLRLPVQNIRSSNIALKSSPSPPTPPPLPPTSLLARDLPLYGLLACLSIVPSIEFGSDSKAFGIVYFFTLATMTLYTGVLRQDLGEAAAITSKNAAAAPFVAGASLFGLYCLLKYTDLDPTTVYQGAACLFALASSSEIVRPLAGLAITGRLGFLSEASSGTELSDEQEKQVMDAGNVPSFALPLLLLAWYSFGPVSTGGVLSLEQFAALTDVLACSIALSALGVLSLESFTAGAALLLGLFCYDAFFVFKSDVMLTVATKVEAPAKFLWHVPGRESIGSAGVSYPFSVLGLGDVVIPGAFVSLMRNIDLDLEAQAAGAQRALPPKPTASLDDKPYFRATVAAYALGLGLTFAANYLTKAGQPALVYIVPSLLLASVATAVSRGELEMLLAYRSARAEAAAGALAAESSRGKSTPE